MNRLTQLIKSDMTLALGVTEPGAIAFSVAKARSYTSGKLKCIKVCMNSGMYKNAFTCGIPNSDKVGNIFAAALGYVAGNANKGLEALADVTESDNDAAQELIEQDKVKVELSGITSRIYIQATVETDLDKAVVTIRNSHTNIIKIEVNEKVVYEGKEMHTSENVDIEEVALIHKYTLADILEYADTVSAEEIDFVSEAYRANLELFHEGLNSSKTTFARTLLEINGGEIISNDERNTASLLCNGAIEARVIGLDKPAMSITGSGAHGIIATMPLYAVYKINHLSEEQLHRATMLSYLVCTYIKEYSGKLSAFCGCAIAAGAGMACGICYLKGGRLKEMEYILNNMASSITGMICDGAKPSCALKCASGVSMAVLSALMAKNGRCVKSVEGIIDDDVDKSIRNLTDIGRDAMVHTDAMILRIMTSKC